MKSNRIAPVLVIAALVGIGVYVSAEEKATTRPTTEPATQPAAENGAVNQFCAVEQHDKIDPKGKTTVYKGKTIGFCCDDCIETFKKDPEKYMATLK